MYIIYKCHFGFLYNIVSCWIVHYRPFTRFLSCTAHTAAAGTQYVSGGDDDGELRGQLKL